MNCNRSSIGFLHGTAPSCAVPKREPMWSVRNRTHVLGQYTRPRLRERVSETGKGKGNGKG